MPPTSLYSIHSNLVVIYWICIRITSLSRNPSRSSSCAFAVVNTKILRTRNCSGKLISFLYQTLQGLPERCYDLYRASSLMASCHHGIVSSPGKYPLALFTVLPSPDRTFVALGRFDLISCPTIIIMKLISYAVCYGYCSPTIACACPL